MVKMILDLQVSNLHQFRCTVIMAYPLTMDYIFGPSRPLPMSNGANCWSNIHQHQCSNCSMEVQIKAEVPKMQYLWPHHESPHASIPPTVAFRIQQATSIII